jgi:hypothetical protein
VQALGPHHPYLPLRGPRDGGGSQIPLRALNH